MALYLSKRIQNVIYGTSAGRNQPNTKDSMPKYKTGAAVDGEVNQEEEDSKSVVLRTPDGHMLGLIKNGSAV